MKRDAGWCRGSSSPTKQWRSAATCVVLSLPALVFGIHADHRPRFGGDDLAAGAGSKGHPPVALGVKGVARGHELGLGEAAHGARHPLPRRLSSATLALR